jgi:hypothetical protein
MPAEMKIFLISKRNYSLDSFDGIENLRPKKDDESNEDFLEDNHFAPLPSPNQSDNQPSKESSINQSGLDKSINNSDTSE